VAGLTRGSLCSVRLGRTAGREQSGRRFAVIIQSDDLWLLNTIVVVPTSTSARAATFRPEIVVAAQRTRVLCEQIRTIDARRIGDTVGMLSTDELSRIEDALEVVLEL